MGRMKDLAAETYLAQKEAEWEAFINYYKDAEYYEPQEEVHSNA